MTDPDARAQARGWAAALQIHDSQFPIGAFAHSGGLETYAQEGFDDASLERYLRAQIDLGWGRLELAAWALAWKQPTPDALRTWDAHVSAWTAVPSLRDASRRRGARVLRLALRLWPELAQPDLVQPDVAQPDLVQPELPAGLHQSVISGAIAARLGIDGPAGLLAFAHGTLSSSLAAATRCMPLSPERAQELLVTLTDPLLDAVDRAWERPEENLWTATPGADLAAHHQTRLTTRLFQT